MSVRGFNTGSGIEQYDYDYLDNKPAAPTKESIGLGNVDNTSDRDKPVSTLQADALSQKVDKAPGMGLSHEDYTSEDKAKLDALPTNAELEAALSGKASAETVAALESAVNDPENGLETKASAIINTASGDIAIIHDGADAAPIKALVANIEPVQDLHGYDNPWPGGGGKNKLQLLDKTITQSSVTFTSNAETGLATTSGTATANANTAIAEMTLPAGNYIYTSGVEESFSTYDTFVTADGTTIARGNNSLSPGNAFTLAEDATVRVQIRQRSGVTTSNLTFKPMIRLATEADATFAPYSNICPISGWTGLSGKRTGKNLLNNALSTTTENGITFTVTADGNVVANGTATSTAQLRIPISTSNLKPGNYYFTALHKKPTDINANAYVWNTINSERAKKWNGTDNSELATDGRFKEFRIEDGYAYNFNLRINEGITVTDLAFNPMICAPTETDPTYEPYAGTEISVTFPTSAGTVYGGTLTINPDRTGQLVVDRAMVTLSPTMSWQYSAITHRFYVIISGAITGNPDVTFGGKCNMFKSGTAAENNAVTYVNGTSPGIAIKYQAANDDMTAWKQFLVDNTVNVVYPLSTPITYTLTATEIDGILTTLYGTNNIWADCGDTEVTYAADTKLYIEHLTQPTEDDMTADHAISAGTFFMLGNTLYLATSQIAAGATITPGTNATQLSLADALNQLNT